MVIAVKNETMTPIAYLTDSEAEPAQILERAETSRNRSNGLQSALSRLDDRSRAIIEARWLREDDDAETLQTLADKYGIASAPITVTVAIVEDKVLLGDETTDGPDRLPILRMTMAGGAAQTVAIPTAR